MSPIKTFISSSLSSLVRSAYLAPTMKSSIHYWQSESRTHQRLCQNPTQVRFLNINMLVGIDKGCFDIAPYDTNMASDPRRRAMAVVEGPETQFNPRRIDCGSLERR